MIDTLIDTYFGNKNVIYSGMAEPIFNWGLGGGGGVGFWGHPPPENFEISML